MSATQEVGARIQALEEIVARQESLILELDAILVELQKRLARLETLSRQQQSRIDAVAASAGSGTAPADDPPPHY